MDTSLGQNKGGRITAKKLAQYAESIAVSTIPLGQWTIQRQAGSLTMALTLYGYCDLLPSDYFYTVKNVSTIAC